ncbi:uncharacterized protein N7496_000674 [Penicillium cataractarum]|uniref:Uncharacterized protein n=1 Tax=Penicillium cataractarum TaxID=2100454 RepID=A0A9W9VUH7_9EURO|nr:uncharacterized protein N7496_000674 [Penicillium cataractarum]KAJ5389606.1 hypothetical protein N7496_000674 [Penicillium cataractarum]
MRQTFELGARHTGSTPLAVAPGAPLGNEDDASPAQSTALQRAASNSKRTNRKREKLERVEKA